MTPVSLAVAWPQYYHGWATWSRKAVPEEADVVRVLDLQLEWERVEATTRAECCHCL